MNFDENEVRKAVNTLKPNNQLYEVRVISGRWNASGYFKGADKLIEALKKYRSHENSNVYITLNAVKEECYSRKQRDKLIDNVNPTTSDTEISGYDWLMIDFDPKRASGTSSSNEQIEKAQLKAATVYNFLEANGWSKPIVAMSGNGYHLLYKLYLGNDAERTELIKNALLVLNMCFADDEIDIDLKTFNPARVCKLYGTVSCKGADTPERPHRLSKIVSVPSKILDNDIELLKRLAELLPQEEPPQKYNNYNPRTFNLDEWIARHNIPVKKVENWNGGKKYILEHCVFDASHRGKDASIIQTADGKLCYNCFHNSCSHNHWRELRLMYEPDAYDKKYVDNVTYPNYKNANYEIEKVEAVKQVDGKPVFYTTEQVRLLETPPEEFIKTGIHTIDMKLRGLKKGFVTCLSGLRACGKSSIISQLSVEAVQQGYRVALYSGELTAKNTLKWLLLQCAGKNNVKPTQYENYYVVSEDKEEPISKWLDNKIFIYNNDYGNDFEKIEASLMQCVVEHKIDLIILDNLMSLNISALGQEKYARQSLFVEHLEVFAKQCNVHILFVAHPRKSQGFLRLDDVSGSNDIVNRVDNALIMHRVNNDFERLTKEMFKWKDDNELYACDNVIEIAKDRDGGTQDYFVPLWFEVQCKRLKNSQWENKVYGWQDEVFTELDDTPDDMPWT